MYQEKQKWNKLILYYFCETDIVFKIDQFAMDFTVLIFKMMHRKYLKFSTQYMNCRLTASYWSLQTLKLWLDIIYHCIYSELDELACQIRIGLLDNEKWRLFINFSFLKIVSIYFPLRWSVSLSCLMNIQLIL